MTNIVQTAGTVAVGSSAVLGSIVWTNVVAALMLLCLLLIGLPMIVTMVWREIRLQRALDAQAKEQKPQRASQKTIAKNQAPARCNTSAGKTSAADGHNQ